MTFFDGEAQPQRLASHSRWSTMLLPSTEGSFTLEKIGPAASRPHARTSSFFIVFFIRKVKSEAACGKRLSRRIRTKPDSTERRPIVKSTKFSGTPLYFLGQFLYDAEIVEKFLGENPDHVIGRNGQQHTEHAGQ